MASNVRLPLTEAQQRVLDAIKAYIKAHGYPPSRAELREACGFASPNATTWHINALVKKGWIERDEHISRGIRVCVYPAQSVR